MAMQPAAEEVLVQGEKEKSLAFSLANISMLSPCLSKLQLPKLESQKQMQDGYCCHQNTAIPNLGGNPGGVLNKGALLFSSLFPPFPIRKPRNHHLNLHIIWHRYDFPFAHEKLKIRGRKLHVRSARQHVKLFYNDPNRLLLLYLF